ncbi:MAG: exopolysaccharide biosynthesis polyprenyl glycosylphosphotransferase [Clostridia bacterium]|nr:exopolysaccharide biosynthesis polyprenyl glycosylphosphotransferase [Clostridia bacterium]
MHIDNMNRLGKWCGILLDIFGIVLTFFVVGRVILECPIDGITYLAGICFVVTLMHMLDSYNDSSSYTIQKKRHPIVLAVALVPTAVIFFVIWYMTGGRVLLPVSQMLIIFAACYPVMLGLRMLLFQILLAKRKKQTLLILWENNCPKRFSEKLMRNAVDYGTVKAINVVEFDESEIESEVKNAHSLLVVETVNRERADRIILLAKWLAKPVCLVPTVENISLIGSSIANVGDTLVLGLKSDRGRILHKAVKRMFDIVVSAFGLILLSPAFGLIAIAIKLDTTGPVFHKQERYTMYKKRFNIIKFRTMVKEAEHNNSLATENDKRITRVGRVLRVHRMDELPQLINIFKGEMSFVGPRPERPIYADEYSKIVRNYDLRYMFKAGLTGLAQVYGQYNTRVSDKILFDWMYIDKFSIWFDIKLLIQTVIVVFMKESAAGVKEDKPKADNMHLAESPAEQ